MSLRVWFPLDGTLENKGLSQVTATNSGATVNSAGKIGKCYSFDKTLLQRLNLSRIADLVDIVKEHDFSVCAWLKTTENRCWLSITYAYRFWSNRIYVPYNNFTSLDNKVIDGKWHHLCYTHSHTTLKNSCYIDGLEVYSNVGTAAATTTYKNAARIGNDVNNSSSVNSHFNGDINDVRIYDHCLSPKEVKEISQGLVLHYPLNGDTDTPIYCNYIQSSGTQWIDTGVVGHMNHTYEIDFQMNDTGDYRTWGAFGQSSYVGYNMSFTWATNWAIRWESTSSGQRMVDNISTKNTNRHLLKISNGYIYLDGVYKGISSGHNSSYSTSYNLFLFTVNPANNTPSSNSKCKIYGYRDIDENGVLVRDMIPCVYNGEAGMWDLVEGEFYDNDGTGSFTADGVLSDNTIYDCSGYGNDGTVIGSVQIDSDTPRYANSTAFTNTSYVRVLNRPKDFLPKDEITVNLWAKWSTWGNPISCTEGDGWNIEQNSTGLRFPVYSSGYKIAQSTFVPASHLNEWHMITGTFDADYVKIYIDGEVAGSLASGGNSITYYNNYLFISAEAGGNSTTPATSTFVGDISDVRIYATALSDADIKELYDTAASIDNEGNLHDFECVEDEVNKGQILKTGIVKTNEFVEKINYLYLPAGKFVNTQLYYENSDQCKAVTVLRYGTVGSDTRDLMGYSDSGHGYWGVKANGTWEPHGTFTYTDVDITKINTVSYTFSSSNEHGNYQVGALAGSWSTRDKYIYSVKLYKNGTLERDLIPATNGTQVGLYDLITKTFYPTNSGGSLSAEPSEAKIFDSHIEANQLIER